LSIGRVGFIADRRDKAKMSIAIIKHLKIEVEIAIETLAVEAKEEADYYWTMQAYYNKDRPNEDLSHHAPRVRIYKDSGNVNVIWERWLYRKNKTLRISRHILPLKQGFVRRCFKKARAWELDVIMETEKTLEPLRRQIKLLQKFKADLNREIRRNEKENDECRDEECFLEQK